MKTSPLPLLALLFTACSEKPAEEKGAPPRRGRTGQTLNIHSLVEQRLQRQAALAGPASHG